MNAYFPSNCKMFPILLINREQGLHIMIFLTQTSNIFIYIQSRFNIFPWSHTTSFQTVIHYCNKAYKYYLLVVCSGTSNDNSGEAITKQKLGYRKKICIQQSKSIKSLKHEMISLQMI